MIITPRLVFDLFKLRIGMVIALTAGVGILVTPGDGPDAAHALVLVVAVLLASAAAGAFNQLYEYDLDQRMQRTARRPFASGRLVRSVWWPAGLAALALAAVGAATVATNWVAALHTFLGAFVYAIVYTVWLKRRTCLNIVVGGLAGSFSVLAGAAAVDPGFTPPSALLALVLFLWTPPHFWSLAIAYRDDYVRANVPMLPVVKGDAAAARAIHANAIALVLASLALAWYLPGIAYLACATTGGAWFLRETHRLLSNQDRRQAMRAFHASLVQLTLVLIGVTLHALLP